MKLELTLEELNVIMAALGRMPYESVTMLVDKIREQATPQLQQQAAPAPTATEE